MSNNSIEIPMSVMLPCGSEVFFSENGTPGKYWPTRIRRKGSLRTENFADIVKKGGSVIEYKKQALDLHRKVLNSQ